MASVDLDGPWTDPEAPGDELVGQSFAEQCQNLPLALAEAFQAFAGILDLAVPSPLPLRFGNGRRQALLEVAGHDRNFEVVECPAGEGRDDALRARFFRCQDNRNRCTAGRSNPLDDRPRAAPILDQGDAGAYRLLQQSRE